MLPHTVGVGGVDLVEFGKFGMGAVCDGVYVNTIRVNGRRVRSAFTPAGGKSRCPLGTGYHGSSCLIPRGRAARRRQTPRHRSRRTSGILRLPPVVPASTDRCTT